MKYLFYLIIPVLFACKQGQEVSTEKERVTEIASTKDEVKNVVNFIGIVHTPKDNCAYVEATLKDGKSYKVYAINLEEKFLQEGTKIKFEYSISRMMIPKNCIADITAKFYNVYRVR